MYKYILPNADNQPKEYSAESNSVKIIGVNGSGKTRLGVWIDKYSINAPPIQTCTGVENYKEKQNRLKLL